MVWTYIPYSLQLNRMTSWIDGSFVYSSQEAWVSTLRSFQNGTLKWMESEEGGTRALIEVAAVSPPSRVWWLPARHSIIVV